MRIGTLFALVVTLISCGREQDAWVETDPWALRPQDIHGRATKLDLDAIVFDTAQRTCALFVAVRSGALEDPAVFGGEIDDSMVHWNLCPGGTMVACAPASAADGNTIPVGIPWPYSAQDL